MAWLLRDKFPIEEEKMSTHVTITSSIYSIFRVRLTALGLIKGSGIAHTRGKMLQRGPINDTASYRTAARTPNLAQVANLC
jgi:hypothetical protein